MQHVAHWTSNLGAVLFEKIYITTLIPSLSDHLYMLLCS